MDYVKRVFSSGSNTGGSDISADKPSSSSAKPKAEERHSEWAKDKEEEDRIEKLIHDSGCWDHHIAVVECMMEHGDWRKCQTPVDVFLKPNILN